MIQMITINRVKKVKPLTMFTMRSSSQTENVVHAPGFGRVG